MPEHLIKLNPSCLNPPPLLASSLHWCVSPPGDRRSRHRRLEVRRSLDLVFYFLWRTTHRRTNRRTTHRCIHSLVRTCVFLRTSRRLRQWHTNAGTPLTTARMDAQHTTAHVLGLTSSFSSLEAAVAHQHPHAAQSHARTNDCTSHAPGHFLGREHRDAGRSPLSWRSGKARRSRRVAAGDSSISASSLSRSQMNA